MDQFKEYIMAVPCSNPSYVFCDIHNEMQSLP